MPNKSLSEKVEKNDRNYEDVFLIPEKKFKKKDPTIYSVNHQNLNKKQLNQVHDTLKKTAKLSKLKGLLKNAIIFL